MKQDKEQQQEAWAAAKPFVRSIVALVIYLRFGGKHEPGLYGKASSAYEDADRFINTVSREMKDKGAL